MTLPLTTRYVKIEAPSDDGGDAYAEDVTYAVTHEAVPAHIGPSTEQSAGDRWTSTDRVLYVTDTVTLPVDARITDLTTGDIFAALWTELTIGLGLDHRTVGLRKSSGAR